MKIRKIVTAFLCAALALGSLPELSPLALPMVDSEDNTMIISEDGGRYIVSKEQTYSSYDCFDSALSGKTDREQLDQSGTVWSVSGYYGVKYPADYPAESFYCRRYEKNGLFGISSLRGTDGNNKVDYYDYRHGITLDPSEKSIYVSPVASYWKIGETGGPSFIEMNFTAPKTGNAVLYEANNEKITGAINSPFYSFEAGKTDKVGVSVLFNGNKIWPAAEEYAVITQADTITEFPDLGVLSFNTGDKLTVRITHLEGYYSQSDIVRLTPAVSYLSESEDRTLNILAVGSQSTAEIAARLPAVLNQCGASAYTVGVLTDENAALSDFAADNTYSYLQYNSSSADSAAVQASFSAALGKAEWDVVVLEGEYILDTQAFNSASAKVAAVCGSGTKTAACFAADVACDPAVSELTDIVLPSGVAISNAGTSYLKEVNYPVFDENGITAVAKTIAAVTWAEALCMWQIDLSLSELPDVPPQLNAPVENAARTALRCRYSLRESKYSESSISNLRGDANFDGDLDAADIENIQQYCLQGNSVTHLKNADINSDGVIDAADTELLRQLLSGAEIPQPQPTGVEAYQDENGKIDISRLTPVTQSETVSENGRNYISFNGKPYFYNAIHWRYNYIKTNPNIDDADIMSIYEEGFRQAKSAGWKSMVQYVYWTDIFDGEKYDFSLIKKFYDLAEKYDMTVQINWFGYDNCGYGGYMPWQTDREKYPKLEVDYQALGLPEELPDLSKDIFINEECEAVTQLMAFLNIYDTDRRTVLIQLENEPDNPEGGNGQWLSQFYNVVNLLDKIGQAVHNSPFKIVTRVNVTANGWNQEIEGLDYNERMSFALSKSGIDLLGRGFYDYGLNDQDEFDEYGNILHTPEIGIVLQRYIGQAIESLSRGYGLGPYQLKNCSVNSNNSVFLGGVNDWSRSTGQKISAKYIYSDNDYKYGVKVDTSNVSAINHSELYAMQKCINSVSDMLATLPRNRMAGFNTYQDAYRLTGDVKTEIRETKALNGRTVSYTFYNPDIEYGGAGMVLADYDDSYYIFATQDNSHFEFSDRIISAETGAFADGAWVSNGEYTPENGYTVTPKAGKVYRIRFSKEYRAYDYLNKYLTAADGSNEPLYSDKDRIEDNFGLSAPWSVGKLKNAYPANDYIVTGGEKVFRDMQINSGISVPGIASYSTKTSGYVGIGFYNSKLLVNGGLSWEGCNGYTNIIKFTAPESGRVRVCCEGGLTPAYNEPIYAQGNYTVTMNVYLNNEIKQTVTASGNNPGTPEALILNISKGDTVTFEIANTGSSYAYTFVDPTVKYEAYG